jgi:hypothetical protein
MRARAVAARDERRIGVFDVLERLCNVFHPPDMRRIALWPDKDEVVVHHWKSLHTVTVAHEFFFLRLRVHEHDVGVATPGGVERLARALRNDLGGDACLLLELWQQIAE